ncbi:MAG: NAD-glutamate dehydrogenase, partial [Mycobacteriaceae bacterium]|nr:NAD-glutamate dehydrogenase [Mycobacteriaceae bacterium]
MMISRTGEDVVEVPEGFRGDLTYLEVAYFRHVDSGAALPTVTAQSDRIFRHHLLLASMRPPGIPVIRVYRPADGTGLGAAVQIVNDDMPLLVESVVATLRRMGATASEVIHPIFDVIRADGRLESVIPRESDGNGHDPLAAVGAVRESWMHVQLTASTPAAVLDRMESALPALLADLRQIVDDTPAMWATERAVAAELDAVAKRTADDGRSAATGSDQPADCAELLRWLDDGHFTMLGYARYRFDAAGTPVKAPDSGFGILRDNADVDGGADFDVPLFGKDRPLLTLTQGTAIAAVHGSVHPYFVGVTDYDDAGAVAGERLFVGMFTVTALHENILDIPVIERRVRRVIEWAGFDLNSFSGQAMLEVMQAFPRVELFSSDARRLFDTTTAVLNLGLRRQVRLFLREDEHSRIVSCLVYLPRDRYTTAVRLAMQDILLREFDGEFIDYSARVTESDLANVYFTIRRRADAGWADTSEAGRRTIQELLTAATRTWADRLAEAATADGLGDPAVAKRYADAFPDGYKEDFQPRDALVDLRRLERLADGSIDLQLYREPAAAPGEWRFALYVGGEGISLSRVLPVLQSLGVEVVDERPYRIDLPDGLPRWIYVFGLRAEPELLRGALDQGLDASLAGVAYGSQADEGIRRRVPDAFAAMWFGRAETDGLNELVLRAGLHWRAVTVLRAYAKYLQQARFPYSLANITRVLIQHPNAAKSFIELFEAYFDPDNAGGASDERVAEIEARLNAQIDAVVSLDTDRILRAMLRLIRATLRTNYFMRDSAGAAREYVSFKFEPAAIPQLPKPKPQFEIFVYSPRVEGVHLRFGAVARGGLRWSDRLEDFRTEILGLVKAQAVKNAVIVPVGAKGGFVVKDPPAVTGDAAADRQALRDEGVACYRTFISGLLDLTDNVNHADGVIVAPERVV